RLGAQAGVGWYRYPGGGGKVVDPLLEDMMVEEAYFARQPRRAFTAEDITARLLLAVTNGAFALLGAGDAAEIDLAAIEGLGLPRDRPGPIALARECGAAGVLARIEALSPEDPGFWRPAPALRAEAG
ncbi:MAG: enoyl-CoA hydratase, partial [Paracoccus sp. (in: a-proteobacteria)]|nr:enoyl-CoA hydratase [Paracoccus sp. (in: a-proteobacteria)]